MQNPSAFTHRLSVSIQKFISFILAALLAAFTSCRESNNPATPVAGDNSLEVLVKAFGEFHEPVSFRGDVKLTLVGAGVHLTVSIPNEESTYVFEGLPSQAYIVHGESDGFYPSDAVGGSTQGWYTGMSLFLVPSLDFQVDSIQNIIGSNSIRTRIVVAQPIPPNGYFGTAIFYGLTPEVGPAPEAHFLDYSTNPGYGDHSVSSYLYPYDFKLPSGTRIYVTARLTTGATQSFRIDSNWYHRVFTNLESNTKIVTSFVLP